MEVRDVKFNKDVQAGLLEGARKVYKAVSSTMGAKGRYVAIQDRFNSHKVTKDGHYTAQSIFLEDEAENVGAQMIKEVAEKTAGQAGDGTTTSTVLAYIMYKLASEAISPKLIESKWRLFRYLGIGTKKVQDYSAIDIKRGILKATDEAVKMIKKHSIPVKRDLKKIKQVATVSANNDESIGELIVNAYKKIKPEGIIKMDVAKGVESTIESVDGMRIDSGYLSPYFVTNPERMYCDLKNAFICLFDGSVSTFKELEPLMGYMAANNGENSLLLIAMNVEQEALQTLVMNKTKGGFKVCAIPAPGQGKSRETLLKDIEAATGSIIISERSGQALKNFKPEHLGSAKSIRITERSTEIVQGGADPDELKKRIDSIKNYIKTEKQKQSVQFHKDRLACIDGGVAIIHVGAATNIEMDEKRDLVEDAIAATKSASEEGVLPGGGSALFHLSREIAKVKGNNEGENKGIEIVSQAMREPFKTIMGNAGLDVEEMVKVMDVNTPELYNGYDLNTQEYCNMYEAGVLDTAKVERMAMENSSSVASMMLMTDTLIYTKNPK